MSKKKKPVRKSRPAAKAKARLSKPRKKARVPVSRTVLHRGPRLPEPKIAPAKPLTASEVSRFREQLLQRREDLVAIVSRKKEQELQVEEPEIGDEADIATRSVEKDILFELTDAEKQTLEMVEAALRKIEKGIFGRCEYCQNPIGKLRMDVMPWARYCIQCQARNEIPSEAL